MKNFRPSMRFLFTSILTVLALPVAMYAHDPMSTGDLGNTGAPGQGQGCANCHGTLGPPTGITIKAPSSYTPNGAAVPVTISIPSTGGFELQILTQSGAQAGTLTAGTGSQVRPFGGSIQDLSDSSSSTSWTFNWTPPTTNVGNVVVYAMGGTHGTSSVNNATITAPSGTPPPAAPSITSANSTAFTVGTTGTFTVTATGTPKPTLSESGTLPGGVTFNALTGVLSGKPAASGTFPITFPITFTAQNGTTPNATQGFTLTVNAATPPSPPPTPPPPPPPAPGGSMSAQPEIHDPSSSGGVSAQYVNHLGDPTPTNSGLVLLKNASAASGTWAGVSILNVSGSLSELGFDYIVGGQCTSTSPRFIVVTTDAVTHVVGGCRSVTAQRNTPAMGWNRVRFDSTALDRANPPITPGMQLRSITLVLDQGPGSSSSSAGGLVVIDNIDVNGTLITGGTASTNPNPNPNPNPAPQPPPAPNPPPTPPPPHDD